jgi:hypothetical protein
VPFEESQWKIKWTPTPTRLFPATPLLAPADEKDGDIKLAPEDEVEEMLLEQPPVPEKSEKIMGEAVESMESKESVESWGSKAAAPKDMERSQPLEAATEAAADLVAASSALAEGAAGQGQGKDDEDPSEVAARLVANKGVEIKQPLSAKEAATLAKLQKLRAGRKKRAAAASKKAAKKAAVAMALERTALPIVAGDGCPSSEGMQGTGKGKIKGKDKGKGKGKGKAKAKAKAKAAAKAPSKVKAAAAKAAVGGSSASRAKPAPQAVMGKGTGTGQAKATAAPKRAPRGSVGCFFGRKPPKSGKALEKFNELKRLYFENTSPTPKEAATPKRRPKANTANQLKYMAHVSEALKKAKKEVDMTPRRAMQRAAEEWAKGASAEAL